MDRQIKKKINDLPPGPSCTSEDLEDVLIIAGSHERMGWLGKLLKARPDIPDDVYWKVLGASYVGCDSLYQHRDILRSLFSSDRAKRECLMNEDESKFLSTLSDEVNIYRGMTASEHFVAVEQYGISWTLDLEKAKFFAFEYFRNFTSEFDTDKLVCSSTIKRKDIIAYFNRRQEQEIVCLLSKQHCDVKVIDRRRISFLRK